VFGVVLPFFKTGYIFEDSEDEPMKRSKFDRLVTALKEIYDELPVSKEEKEEYQLFISGHSLGGALCNLFAFGVAETQQGHPLFNRVTAVSFASPVVGTKGYNKAFQVSALFGSGSSNGTSL
jgi:alpha-beta hydrolase superfamily lysophospholipase